MAALLLCTELFHIYSGVNSDPPRAFACGILKALGGCCSSCLHFYSLTAKLREMQLPDCTARARGEGWPAPCVPCCQAEGMCEHCSKLTPAFISCTEGVAGPSSCPGQRGVMLAHRPPPQVPAPAPAWARDVAPASPSAAVRNPSSCASPPQPACATHHAGCSGRAKCSGQNRTKLLLPLPLSQQLSPDAGRGGRPVMMCDKSKR